MIWCRSMVDSNYEVPEFMEGGKYHIDSKLTLYFPPLSKEEFSKKQSALGKRKTKPSWPKGKPRPNSSIAAKKQWAEPNARIRLAVVARMKNGGASEMGKSVTNRDYVTKATTERNIKRQKCIKMMNKYGLDTPNFGRMSDDALNALYEDLAQWAI